MLHLGLGLCLIKVPEVGSALAAQAEREGRSARYPLFAALPDPDGARHPNGDDKFVGEDVYFFDRLRAAGIDLHVDHGLCREVGPIADIHLAFPG